MKKRLSLFLVLVLMFSLLVGCSGDNGEPAATSEGSEGTEETDGVKDEDIYVAVISKGFQHEFWQTVKMGCDKAGEELGIRVTFEGPEAKEKGMPVLTFDSSLKSDIPLSFVATDNKQVGAIALKGWQN